MFRCLEDGSLRGCHGLQPFSRFVQLLEGPALDAGRSRRLDVADRELAKIRGRRFTGGKPQAAFHSPRKPLVNNPESVLGRDGRQSSVVAQNLVGAVLANERKQFSRYGGTGPGLRTVSRPR